MFTTCQVFRLNERIFQVVYLYKCKSVVGLAAIAARVLATKATTCSVCFEGTPRQFSKGLGEGNEAGYAVKIPLHVLYPLASFLLNPDNTLDHTCLHYPGFNLTIHQSSSLYTNTMGSARSKQKHGCPGRKQPGNCDIDFGGCCKTHQYWCPTNPTEYAMKWELSQKCRAAAEKAKAEEKELKDKGGNAKERKK
ncbi:hypothetical protein J1614_002316 [Plenodomus biglobosus]|nr:hypothetical protein J1614_002316 [Plenodomus biglobosus]